MAAGCLCGIHFIQQGLKTFLNWQSHLEERLKTTSIPAFIPESINWHQPRETGNLNLEPQDTILESVNFVSWSPSFILFPLLCCVFKFLKLVLISVYLLFNVLLCSKVHQLYVYIYMCVCAKVFQLCQILCDPMCWWWTGRPGVLRFMGSQRVGHNWATDLIWSVILCLWNSLGKNTRVGWYALHMCVCVCIYISPLFWISFPFWSPQSTE